MATYTGVSDNDGNFTIPFTENYTGGQKVTVTAEKDGDSKSIELFAPSDVTGGGFIQISGDLTDFPKNIGVITLSSDVSGVIATNAMSAQGLSDFNFFRSATGLVLSGQIVEVQASAFAGWTSASSINLPNSLVTIGASSFLDWSSLQNLKLPNSVRNIGSGAFNRATSLLNLELNEGLTTLGGGSAFANMTSCKKIIIPSTMQTMSAPSIFANLTRCEEVICKAINPPPINQNCFSGISASCIFKVPTASVDAYKSAAGWSTFASRIVAI